MTILTKQHEVGSSGYMWQNLMPDSLLDHVRLHVYYAHNMYTDISWAGNQFTNHYNRIYFVESGFAVLEFDGFEIEMRPGHLYLIPPNSLKSHYSRGSLHFYWAHFQLFFDGDLDFMALFCEPAELAPDCIESVIDTFDRLVDSVKEARESDALRRNMMVTDLIQPFIEKSLSDKSLTSKYELIRFLPVLKLIEKRIKEKISMSELAAVMGVTPEHFSRIFKSAFKVTPNIYIHKKRINMAKQMLLLSDRSVSDIACECGFCDQYYFSKSFKRQEGCTPTSFRKMHYQNEFPVY